MSNLGGENKLHSEYVPKPLHRRTTCSCPGPRTRPPRAPWRSTGPAGGTPDGRIAAGPAPTTRQCPKQGHTCRRTSASARRGATGGGTSAQRGVKSDVGHTCRGVCQRTPGEGVRSLWGQRGGARRRAPEAHLRSGAVARRGGGERGGGVAQGLRAETAGTLLGATMARPRRRRARAARRHAARRRPRKGGPARGKGCLRCASKAACGRPRAALPAPAAACARSAFASAVVTEAHSAFSASAAAAASRPFAPLQNASSALFSSRFGPMRGKPVVVEAAAACMVCVNTGTRMQKHVSCCGCSYV